jgi:AmiR/NasT family two-component response regulator
VPNAAVTDFRQLHAVVVHPRDSNGELLIRQLQRFGCRVDNLWPPVGPIGANVDVVLCLVQPETRQIASTLGDEPNAAMVAVVEQDDPGMLQLLADFTPQAVIHAPFNGPAILTNIMVARNNSRYQRRLQSKISKLEETLRSVRKVERAKAILMEQRKIDEAEAYAYLRDQAMKKRLPIGVIASIVVDSNDVLAGDGDENENESEKE